MTDRDPPALEEVRSAMKRGELGAGAALAVMEDAVRAGDEELLARAQLADAAIARLRSRFDAAHDHYERSLAQCRRRSDPAALAACHDGLALARQHGLRAAERNLVDEAKRCGDTAAALAHFQRFHELDRELGNEQALIRAELAGVKLELEWLRGQQARLKRDALVDPLTGAANRRYLGRWLEDAPELPDGITAIAMIDLDHFKQVNDRWSHQIGDRVPRKIAEIARAVLRAGPGVRCWRSVRQIQQPDFCTVNR